MHARRIFIPESPSALSVKQERRVTALMRAKHVLREEAQPVPELPHVLVSDLIELAEWILAAETKVQQ